MTDVKEAKKIVKNLTSVEPKVATKAAKIILSEVKAKTQWKSEKKSIAVVLTPGLPEVTFTGNGWCAVDIKMCYAAIVRKFKENLRELYRKEYKVK